MEATFRIADDILIACIKGDIDHHSASYLRRSIDRSMKQFGCRDVVLDFSNVGFMDSAGIGVVLGRYKKLLKTGGSVCVSGCSEYTARLLDMAGVFSLVDRAQDFDSATERIMASRRQGLQVNGQGLQESMEG